MDIGMSGWAINDWRTVLFVDLKQAVPPYEGWVAAFSELAIAPLEGGSGDIGRCEFKQTCASTYPETRATDMRSESHSRESELSFP